jgi:FkbM family methyltransferase
MEINLTNHLKNKVTGAIHVGAHEGQERTFYRDIGANPVVWHEANPDMYKRLIRNLSGYKNQEARHHAVSDFNGKIKFNISNNDGSSSSILDLKDHKKYYPHIRYENVVEVDCVTLDDYYKGRENLFNSLFIDVQGAEYKVLRGAENLLKNNIKYVYTEVNFEELYDGCKLIGEVDEHLNGFGFKRTHLHDTNHGWGDAFYQKI